MNRGRVLRPFIFPLVLGSLLLFYAGATANQIEPDWVLDLQISDKPDLWDDNLDEVLVGTPLRYRLLIKNTSPLDMTYLLNSNSMFDVVTMTVSAGEQSLFQGSTMPALPGFHSSIVTGTASFTNPGITITLPVNPYPWIAPDANFTSTLLTPYPPVIVDIASYTGVSPSVPEPSTLLLIGLGALGFVGLRRKLRR